MTRLKLTVLVPLLYLVAPSAALADATPNPRPGLVPDPTQTYTLLIGALVPLATYVLNHYAPWCSEKVKALVHVVVAAVAAGLYQALASGHIGFDTPTLQILGTAVIAALFAHRLLWAPSGIAAHLGAGRDAPRRA